MEQVETLPPLRVMLVCCNELVPELLQAYLAQTQWWQPADGDICYGALKLHALVLTPVERTPSDTFAVTDPVQRFGDMQLERISVIRQQHDWLIPAEALARIELLVLQHDWLIFVDPQGFSDAAPVSLQEHQQRLSMLQLLVAEHLHRALISRLTLKSAVFILGQCDHKSADWSTFYQQLDINSRWQAVIECRWLLSRPAVAINDRLPMLAEQQAEHFAAQLYLLLLAGLSSDIGPWLNDLSPRYLIAEPATTTPRVIQQYWLDWQVLLGEVSLPHRDISCDTVPTMQYQLPASSLYNADVQLTAIAIQQGSLFADSPMLHGQPCSHHWFSQLRVCVKQLPAQLAVTHLLLLQSKRARPLWQLQGYWRLRLV